MKLLFLIGYSNGGCVLRLNIFSGLIRKAAKKPEPGTSEPGSVDSKVFKDEELKNEKISRSLKKNVEYLDTILGRNVDAVFREFRLGAGKKENACLVYLDSLTDETRISENILKPLLLGVAGIDSPGDNLTDVVGKSILVAAEIRSKVYNMQDVVSEILYGGTALFIDGCEEAVITILKEWPQRPVDKADVEGTVRGPKESFNEIISVSTSLVRRRLRTPNLVIEGLNLGRMTHTSVAVAYLKGVVSPGLLKEVRQRIDRIDIDGILESGYIEELIQDDPYSPFPQIAYTERPDRVVAALLQGRVCVFTDGTPMVLFMPATFSDLVQNPEDYYERYHFATMIRLIRSLGLAVALLLPSFYIAITTFHQEMIPTQLLISIAASREGVPFPALVEALIMEITFEALREAGLRLPRAVGQAVSIVGALVIGQAAVQAGIVSPLMVIVVAVTGIASFMSPSYSLALALRLIRFPLMFLAATLGLFGVMTGVLAMLIHLAGLRSFGVPYLSPLTPLKISDLKDFVVRAPWWAMHKRPSELVKRNVRRIAPDLKPQPPTGSGDEKAFASGHESAGPNASTNGSGKHDKVRTPAVSRAGSKGGGGSGQGA
ncbi:Spore germination protein B1 [Pelotomaculum sp. FP]|nr:Spore germination protein B1 [Pelotomaculum sp. FP]